MFSDTVEPPPAAASDFATSRVSAGSGAGRLSVSGDLALFHRALAELCRANVPLSRALRLLQADLDHAGLRGAVGEMASQVEAGIPLSEAYRRHEKFFPGLYRALVEAGIEAGDLPSVLDEIARHADDRARVSERVRRALAYPAVAACFVIVLGLLLLVFVGPQLREALANISYLPGVQSEVAAGTPPWIVAAGALGLLVFALTGALVFAWLRNPLDAGGALSGLGYRMPLIGRLRLFAAKASFASTMALLARRQLPLPRALALASAATEDQQIRACIDSMAERAREGASLTEAVRAGQLVSPSLLWLVEAAEQSGSAASALGDVARVYRDRLDRAVDRLCTMATPLAELLLGIVVLGFAMTYMFPMAQYTEQLMGR